MKHRVLLCLTVLLLDASLSAPASQERSGNRPALTDRASIANLGVVQKKRIPGLSFPAGIPGNAVLALKNKVKNDDKWNKPKNDGDAVDDDIFKIRGKIQKLGKNRIWVSGQKIRTRNTTWLDYDRQPVSSEVFTTGDRVVVRVEKKRKTLFASSIRLLQEPGKDLQKVALLFVGHGEPEKRENGDIPITLADGTPFGPHAESLGVPGEFQHTEWAAAYEEIATAMTYIFPDSNGNGIEHEIAMFPAGDVPGFFTWTAFHASIYQNYEATANYSPHNDAIREHVQSLDIRVKGAEIDVYVAFLDAVPRIRDVAWEIANQGIYQELVVVPILLAGSTHTLEVTSLVEEAAHLTSNMEVVVTEPFFEIPYMQRRMRDAAVARAHYLRDLIPADVSDHNIGVLLASHGTPYSPPFPEFGWKEGEIFSELLPTEDAFHVEIARKLPWMARTGRMNYSSPTIEDALQAFEVDGFTHVLVVPSVFPTSAIHTMWDVANAAVDRPVLPGDKVVSHTRPTGINVYYSAEGLADLEPGRQTFREGLTFVGKTGVLEALAEGPDDSVVTPYTPCGPEELCVTLTADQVSGGNLRIMLYLADNSSWPQDFQNLPAPDFVVITPPPAPERFPARIRISLVDNLLPLSSATLDGARLGLVIASGEGDEVSPEDNLWFSPTTVVYGEDGLNFGSIDVYAPEQGCDPGDICITVTGGETTGPDLKLLLYETTEEGWPQSYLTLPTPSWVVTESPAVPENFPIHIKIPMAENLFAITSEPLEGARLGLAVVTGVASTFIVEPIDARGFSGQTLVYEPGAVMDYGSLELQAPAGDVCDLNPFNPGCLTGPLFWQEHFLGEEGFVPGAIYMDVADIDEDGIDDLIMVGEPHFEEPNLPLTTLKLGVYYLNDDFTVRENEIIDAWSENDPEFYSPWGVRVIQHAGAPMIIVGTNIPGLAPLEDGTGAILSYRRESGEWLRSAVRSNPNPDVTNYNAMIVVPADIDGDGDEDLALSGAFESSSIGSWMENTGQVDDPWIPHLQIMEPGTDPAIRGTLSYKSEDLNGDGYPEVVYNAMFDIPNTDPPRYRGEIWLGVNPGSQGANTPWQKIVIDDDNWASADMWFHDFDDDGFKDLVANQIFSSTVTVYLHPGDDLGDPWEPKVIISGLTSPSDMWLADMDEDGLIDVVSADHTAHRGVWHKNPGTDLDVPWQSNLIFRNIRLPGDFAMTDLDNDGDLDWAGTSLTLGQAFVMEQVQPDSSLVANMSLPDNFGGQIRSLMLVLADSLPILGPPAAVLATIDNGDLDGNGIGDVDEILNSSSDLVLALENVGLAGDYHVMAVLFMEGGGQFAPMPGIDYMAVSHRLTLGQGKQEVMLELELAP